MYASSFETWLCSALILPQQSELVSMVDVIAQHPSCTQVKQWFMQAVPKLSEYLVVPDSRTLDVRFKLAANTPTMAKIIGSEVRERKSETPSLSLLIIDLHRFRLI